MRDFVYGEIGLLGWKIAGILGLHNHEPINYSGPLDGLSELNQRKIQDYMAESPLILGGGVLILSFKSLFKDRNSISRAEDLPNEFYYHKINQVKINYRLPTTYQYDVEWSGQEMSCRILNKSVFLNEMKSCNSSDLSAHQALLLRLNSDQIISATVAHGNNFKNRRFSTTEFFTKFELLLGTCAAVAIAAVAVGVVLYMKPDLLDKVLGDTKTASSFVGL